MNHFTEAEFFCNCGCDLCFDDMDVDFIIRIDQARGHAGVPFILTSTVRCKDHNAVIGASKTSSHPEGLAVDIESKSSYDRYRILYGLMKAGIPRIGISKKSIHADQDQNKPK